MCCSDSIPSLHDHIKQGVGHRSGSSRLENDTADTTHSIYHHGEHIHRPITRQRRKDCSLSRQRTYSFSGIARGASYLKTPFKAAPHHTTHLYHLIVLTLSPIHPTHLKSLPSLHLHLQAFPSKHAQSCSTVLTGNHIRVTTYRRFKGGYNAFILGHPAFPRRPGYASVVVQDGRLLSLSRLYDEPLNGSNIAC